MKVGANVGFTQSHQTSNPNMATSWSSTNLMYYTTYIAPIYPVYVRVLDGSGNPVIRTDEFGREQYDYGVAATNYGIGRGFMQTGNPFGSNRYNRVFNDGRNLTGTFNADFDITQHLKAVVQSTVNWGNTLTGLRQSRRESPGTRSGLSYIFIYRPAGRGRGREI